MINSKRDTSGRIVSIALKISDFCINLGNIYAPTNLTERKLFFESFHEYFLPADAIVIAGDFNCYEYHLDKFGGNVSCAKYLSDFCSAFKLVDAYILNGANVHGLILLFLSVPVWIRFLFLRVL